MANTQKSPINVKVDVHGLQDLIGRLRDLDRKAARKAVKDGVNEVSKLVMWEAKSLVPKRTGSLRKSVTRKVKSAKDNKRVYAVIKPRGGEKFRRIINGKPVSALRYAHLVEYGRVAVVAKKKKVLAAGTKGVSGLPGQGVIFGTKVRAVPPRPFMRPAWAKYQPLAPGIIKKHLDKAMSDFWVKSRTKNKGRK